MSIKNVITAAVTILGLLGLGSSVKANADVTSAVSSQPTMMSISNQDDSSTLLTDVDGTQYIQADAKKKNHPIWNGVKCVLGTAGSIGGGALAGAGSTIELGPFAVGGGYIGGVSGFGVGVASFC